MSQENVEIVRRLWADLETEDLEASIHLLDKEVELWNAPEFPVTGPYRGHDGVRQWAALNNGRYSAAFTTRSRRSSKPLTARPSSACSERRDV